MKIIITNIFKIACKSMISTLIIGYFIFNLVYIMNDCPPYKNNILAQRCEDSMDLHEKNVILDQRVILSSYISWIKKAVILDFGPKKYRSTKQIFPQVVNHFMKTFKLIFGSVCIAFLLSMFMYRLSLYKNIKKYIIGPLISVSFLHLSIFIFLFSQYTQSTSHSSFDDLVVCLILMLSNGMLYDYYSLLKDDHDIILNKDYAVFAKHSGYKQYIFASKELVISFITITISRIPILFAGMTILEVLSKGKYQAIGYDLWKNFYLDTNYAVFFGTAFVIVLFFTFLYFMAEHLRLSLSPKLNKT